MPEASGGRPGQAVAVFVRRAGDMPGPPQAEEGLQFLAVEIHGGDDLRGEEVEFLDFIAQRIETGKAPGGQQCFFGGEVRAGERHQLLERLIEAPVRLRVRLRGSEAVGQRIAACQQFPVLLIEAGIAHAVARIPFDTVHHG